MRPAAEGPDGVLSSPLWPVPFGPAPVAGAEGAGEPAAALDWDVVGRLLPFSPDVLVVRDGKLRAGPPPASLEEARALFAEGWSLVLRGTERFDAGLAAVAGRFAKLGGRVQVQVYLTPAGAQGFGWHYDAEHVYIVQAGGAKDYYFRENTVNPRPRQGAMPRDQRFEDENSPSYGCRLARGGWLYLPRGWWHAAKAVEDSLSISVGVLEPDAA